MNCAAHAAGSGATIDLHNTVTGEPLKLDEALANGHDTPAVKQFLSTGHNPYNEVKSCFPSGKSLFLTACSGCHGEYAEGKLGPNLGDNYWTYPINTTDEGLFATIFGGANGMMGPHNEDLTLDEILQVMAWVRHLYSGPVQDAPWFTEEQKKNYAPYKLETDAVVAKADGLCAPSNESARHEPAK
ncbi:cytochrome c(L), periplasmic [Methylocapsa polymorpha]|uniref:Cytochrome c-L n=2 Tax=Methylocapsa polymorpha TaxID=3080828 RepID=A0ABZ0HW29_9HYPH|nr:cytochrome c(L), periplasmic [Methylocapsa sp. RX1]